MEKIVNTIQKAACKDINDPSKTPNRKHSDNQKRGIIEDSAKLKFTCYKEDDA